MALLLSVSQRRSLLFLSFFLLRLRRTVGIDQDLINDLTVRSILERSQHGIAGSLHVLDQLRLHRFDRALVLGIVDEIMQAIGVAL